MRKKNISDTKLSTFIHLEGVKETPPPTRSVIPAVFTWPAALCGWRSLVGGGRDTVREIQSNDEVCGSYPRA